MAEEIPMAWDLTAEADSGGHTDNQSPLTLMPTMIALKDRLADQYGYDRPLRVGAAGGIASPVSALGAFSMGAAYIVTGSINQSAVESGTSELVRDMLAQTGQADVTMAPAGDMFELGVQVQVLKWGTMFAMRAARLYELYKHYDDLDGLPPAERRSLEKTCFRAPLEDIWDQTKAWFMDRDPSQVARAEQDPKYRMALIFRWYLGQASGWANQGDESRKIDFQIFCGPAMGAFNEWVRGSFLEAPHRRDVVTLALNLLFGAAVRYRLGLLERQGVRMPHRSADVRPLEASAIKEYLS
jgi:PfaD family protein